MGQRIKEKDLSNYEVETILRHLTNKMLVPGYVGRQRLPRDWFWKDGDMYTPSTIQHRWVEHGERPWRPYG